MPEIDCNIYTNYSKILGLKDPPSWNGSLSYFLMTVILMLEIDCNIYKNYSKISGLKD